MRPIGGFMDDFMSQLNVLLVDTFNNILKYEESSLKKALKVRKFSGKARNSPTKQLTHRSFPGRSAARNNMSS